jgi:hypothetical protein
MVPNKQASASKKRRIGLPAVKQQQQQHAAAAIKQRLPAGSAK